MDRRTLSVIALAAAACYGSSPPRSPPPPPPPPLPELRPPDTFTAREVTFGHLELHWTPAPPPIDGYEVDRRVGAGPWQRLLDGPDTALAVGAGSDLDPGVPELSPLSFRIRAVRGASQSAYAQADLVHGVHPPGPLTASVGTARSDPLPPVAVGPVSLSWTNESRVATDLLLERSAFAGAGPWVPLPATFGATSFEDATAEEQIPYAYRLRYGAGGILSDPALASPPPIEMFAPAQVAVQPVPGGYRVSWVNRSQVATSLFVTRQAPFPEPSIQIGLPVTADHFDDIASAFFPNVRYFVEVQSAPGPTLTVISAPLPIPPFTVGAGPLLFGASSALMPGATSAARDGAGQFHLAGLNGGQLFVHRPTGATWETHAETASDLVSPGIGVDGLGHPHALFVRGPLAPGVRAHVWHDGASWQVEDLPLPACLGERFGVSADGRVHLSCIDAASSAFTYRVRDVAWSAPESPSVATVSNFHGSLAGFEVARDGTAYALFLGGGGPDPAALNLFVVLLQRSPDGVWTELSHQVGTGVLPAGSIPATAAWMLPADAGHAAFLYTDAPSPSLGQLLFIQVGPAGLGSPEVVFEEPSLVTGIGLELSGAVSDDGARVHVLSTNAIVNESTLTLRVRTPTGWLAAPFSPPALLGAFPTGYGPDGKAWALANFDGFGTTTLTEHALYLESGP